MRLLAVVVATALACAGALQTAHAAAANCRELAPFDDSLCVTCEDGYYVEVNSTLLASIPDHLKPLQVGKCSICKDQPFLLGDLGTECNALAFECYGDNATISDRVLRACPWTCRACQGVICDEDAAKATATFGMNCSQEIAKNPSTCNTATGRDLCPESCGLCTVPQNHPCSDDEFFLVRLNGTDKTCDDLKARGCCNASSDCFPLAKQQCPDTCGVCPTSVPLCKNNDAYMKYQWRALPCTSMAEFNDACTRYPWSDFLYDLMTVNCPETCGFCGCEDDNALAAATLGGRTCVEVSQDGLCSPLHNVLSEFTQAHAACPRTCRSCSERACLDQPELLPAGKTCRNIRSQGLCSSDDMGFYCQRTCNQCVKTENGIQDNDVAARYFFKGQTCDEMRKQHRCFSALGETAQNFAEAICPFSCVLFSTDSPTQAPTGAPTLAPTPAPTVDNSTANLPPPSSSSSSSSGATLAIVLAVLAFVLVLVLAIAGYIYVSRTRRRMESYAFPLEKSPEWDETAMTTVALDEPNGIREHRSTRPEPQIGFASNVAYATAVQAATKPTGYADLKPGHKTYSRATLRRPEDKRKDGPDYTYVDNDGSGTNPDGAYYTAPGAAADHDGTYAETRHRTAKQPSPYSVATTPAATAPVTAGTDRDGYMAPVPVANPASAGYASFGAGAAAAGGAAAAAAATNPYDGNSDHEGESDDGLDGFGKMPPVRSDGRNSLRLASVSRHNPLVAENRYETEGNTGVGGREDVQPYEQTNFSNVEDTEFI